MRGLAIALVKEYDQRYACAVRRHFDGCWSIRIGEGKQEKYQRKGTEKIFKPVNCLAGRCKVSDRLDGRILIRTRNKANQPED